IEGDSGMLPISWNRFAIRLVMIALLLGGAGAGMWYALRPPATTISSRLASSGEMLSAPPGEGFQRVSIARDFTFPTDHGPHREYQTEWWYYTGNLTSDDRRWGYQLTFFRQG